ncbi:Protein prenyltransferase, alpha subunit [Dillenia turbinata]|uniref:Geranylgeranyl transferase type-2 subunit alpha n=1 Tax=Dillenia turbinata TaxID=194707 RepID=A0AAN8WER2_9MAGN
MHGRPRKPTKLEDEEAKAAKSAKLRSLQSQLLHNHHNKIYTNEALEISAKLLEINPEFYTAWNYRKLALQHNLSLSHSDSNTEDDVITSLLNEELRITESALRQNFKSYGAWHHRKWVLAKGHSSVDHEMRLLHKFHKADPRNFNAWNYRRFVAELMKRSEEEELKFTTEMINSNISNYSAWHNRSYKVVGLNYSGFREKMKKMICYDPDGDDAEYEEDDGKGQSLVVKSFVVPCFVYCYHGPHCWNFLMKIFPFNEMCFFLDDFCSALLSDLLRRGVQGFSTKEKVLTEELELVHQAIFTDEDDQSGWFYHLWLLDQTIKLDVPLLVSTWPAHGSDLTTSVDGFLEDCSFSSSIRFYSKSRKFPLVLHFNHPVEGVSPSTVDVNYAFNAKNEIIWTPLSRNNSGTAGAWVTHLNFPDVKVDSSNTYPVEVSLGNSQGIISLNGFHYSQPSRFAFTVRILPHRSQSAGEQSSTVVWKEEYFHPIHESSLVVAFDQTSNNVDNELSKWRTVTINDEIALFRDLLSVTNCKIGKLTLARLLVAHDVLMQQNKASYKMLHSEEVLELYDDLMKMDPSHCEYYKHERSFALMQEVTANKESLLKHCFSYRGSMPSSLASSICLRLNAYSLSQIGCIGQLLWVQMLDLSHNELHSIEVFVSNLVIFERSSFVEGDSQVLSKALKHILVICKAPTVNLSIIMEDGRSVVKGSCLEREDMTECGVNSDCDFIDEELSGSLMVREWCGHLSLLPSGSLNSPLDVTSDVLLPFYGKHLWDVFHEILDSFVFPGVACLATSGQTSIGLEAMQLLCCLNLSHNKICSFTALEPLTLLKSLKVLDISYNEIGAHPIDTTRYLCSSPLSHTGEWNVTEFEGARIELKKYWEAFVLFKGMSLMQLDIMGNVVNDENFKSFLVELIPKLRRLNGEELH